MLKAGEVYENPVTGERAVIRIGTDTTGGERLVVDLYVQPGGAVMGEHFHPRMEERFTMLAWSCTVQGENGPVQASGYRLDVLVREGDAWQECISCYNVATESTAPK